MDEEKRKPDDVNHTTIGTVIKVLPTVPNSASESFVDYDGPNDVCNPRNWSKAYKWSLMVIISGLSMTT